MNFLFLPLIFLLFNASIAQHYVFSNHAFYDIHRMIELGIFGLLGVLLLLSDKSGDRLIGSYRKLPVLSQIFIPIFFLLGVLSSLMHPTDTPYFGLLWVGHLAMLFLLTLYIAGLYSEHAERLSRVFLVLILICGAYYLYLEWSHYLLTQYWVHFFPDRPLDTDLLIQNLRFPQYSNPRFLGQVLSWVLPLSVLPALLFKKNKALGLVSLIVPTGLWQMFWMSQSRALYVQLLLTALIISFCFRKQKEALLPYLKTQGITLLIGLFLYVALYHWGYSLPERSLSENTGEPGRLAIWHFTLTLIGQHPWLGIGSLNFIEYAGKIFNISHPHNAVLLIAVEWGIPAGILFAGLILWALVRWVRFATHPPLEKQTLFASLSRMALTASLISGLINAQFSGTLVMPASQVFLSLVIGLSLGMYQYEKRAPATIRRRIFSLILMRVLVLLIAFVMLKALFPMILSLPEAEQQACEKALDAAHPDRCPIIPSYFANHAGIET